MYLCNMRPLYFLFCIVFVTSCGEDPTDKSIKNQSKAIVADIPMALFSGEMSFNDEFVTVKTVFKWRPDFTCSIQIKLGQSCREWYASMVLCGLGK